MSFNARERRGRVFALNANDFLLSERSERALRECGFAMGPPLFREAAVADALREANEPLLLLQAGAWLTSRPLDPIPPSATGLPLAACGRTVDDPAWEEYLTHGGALPRPHALYLEPAASHALAELLRDHAWPEALTALWQCPSMRCVQLPELRCRTDPALRILQVVTTIQLGGAERVTLDLTEESRRRGARVWVASLGRSSRRENAPPAGFLDLSRVERTPAARAEAIGALARQLRLDVIHGHLLSAAECAALRQGDVPFVLTMHNMPQGWPTGFAAERRADLLLACSQAVREKIREARLPGPCRTAWNGIEGGRYAPSPARARSAQEWRLAKGWELTDFVVISVANPRPQKRLERIPAILAELQALLPERRVRGLLVGEINRRNADDLAAQAALESEIARCSGRVEVTQVGGSTDVPMLLAASDAFLSTSDYEGLSLAQLEALASGLPVVCTEVGGAPEIAREMGSGGAWYRSLPVDAPMADFARALTQIPVETRASRLPSAFHRARMAARVEQLYRATLSMRLRERREPEGIWLITNNFSMGGAQSSARRLLAGLAARGVKVRACTIQEESPTAGASALREQGITVEQIPARHLRRPEEGVLEILALASAEPPKAILFWNLIPAYKLLLADGLPGVRCFDVSPGEMNFRSLADYFAAPRPELPYRSAREYGETLAGAVVKFAGEKARAEAELGCPVSVIPNGVEECQTPPAEPNGKLIFGTAARIAPDKRLEELLAAFYLAHASLPPYELHLAGRIENGAAEYARLLREIGSALPLVWRGELAGTAEFLGELQIFVMVSEPAGCPNASLEAMAAGLPVIATAVGGAGEQVIERVTGLLTPRGDTPALAAALVELAHGRAAQLRYGAAGRARARREFSLAAMVSAYAALVCAPG